VSKLSVSGSTVLGMVRGEDDLGKGILARAFCGRIV